jgi:hypothetical protein
MHAEAKTYLYGGEFNYEKIATKRAGQRSSWAFCSCLCWLRAATRCGYTYGYDICRHPHGYGCRYKSDAMAADTSPTAMMANESPLP